MFIQNKYYNWYNQIINFAKLRHPDASVYYERHHIIPKSLGGSDGQQNLVKLTAREHFVCHLLLVKCVYGELHKFKMMNAIAKFMNARSYQMRVLNSRQYQLCREYSRQCAKYFSQFRAARSQKSIQQAIDTNYKRYGAGSSRKGAVISEEQIQKMKTKRAARNTWDSWMINVDANEARDRHRERMKKESIFVKNNPSLTKEGQRKQSLVKRPGLFVTPWGVFECRKDFDEHKICALIGFENIFYLKGGLDRPIKTRAINRANLPLDWFNKTWREVGFDILQIPSD